MATVVGAALAGQKILFVSREISSLTQTVSLAASIGVFVCRICLNSFFLIYISCFELLNIYHALNSYESLCVDSNCIV